MFHSLLDNALILIFVGFIYSQLLYRHYRIHTGFQVISGILFGLGAIISMHLSFPLAPGTILDGRSIILSIAAYVGGPLTGFIAMVIGILFRLILGGGGTLTGVLVIIVSTITGWLFYRIDKKKKIKYPLLFTLMMGVVVHLAMIFLFITLPITNKLEVISTVWFPVLVIFPIATGFIGWFFYEQKSKYRNIKKIQKNEKLLQLAFMGTRDGIWIWDIDRGITFDDRWDMLLGYDKNEIEYTPDWFLSQVHPEDLNKLDDAFNNYVSGNKDRYEVEYRIKTKSGEWRWIWGIGLATEYDEAGNPVQITGTHRDITERKNLEEKLRKNEERLILAQKAAKMGTWETDLKSGKTTWSATIEKIVDRSSEPGISGENHLMRYIHPSDKERVEKEINKAVKSGKSFSFEHRILRDDKRIIWISNTGKVTKKNGTPDKIIGIIQNITARKEAEIRMNNSVRTFKALFNNSMDGIVYSNFNNQYIYGNDAFHKITGYSAEEMSGKTWYEITPEKWHRKQDELYQNVLIKYGKSGLFEKEYKHKDGSIIPVQLSSSLDYDDQGNPVGIWSIVRDITEQVNAEKKLEEQKKYLKENVRQRTEELEKQTKNLEETQKALTYLLEDMNDSRLELEKSNRKMESAIKELEAFSYSVSHDLRAPLRSIDGFSHALLEDYEEKLDTMGKDFLHRIHKSSVRMAQLIEDLLQLSRISRADVFIESINISVMCKEIIEFLVAQEKKRKVNIKIEPNLNIRSDRRLVRIMLENLLGNAWKFTRKSRGPKIEIGRSNHNNAQEQEGLTLFIKDNGTGFDTRYETDIYLPFKRLHDESEFEGTGIGLATVKRITNRLNIDICAESEKGKGSAFYLRFPEYL